MLDFAKDFSTSDDGINNVFDKLDDCDIIEYSIAFSFKISPMEVRKWNYKEQLKAYAFINKDKILESRQVVWEK